VEGVTLAGWLAFRERFLLAVSTTVPSGGTGLGGLARALPPASRAGGTEGCFDESRLRTMTSGYKVGRGRGVVFLMLSGALLPASSDVPIGEKVCRGDPVRSGSDTAGGEERSSSEESEQRSMT
jgi:hypothetical protein